MPSYIVDGDFLCRKICALKAAGKYNSDTLGQALQLSGLPPAAADNDDVYAITGSNTRGCVCQGILGDGCEVIVGCPITATKLDIIFI